MTEDTGQFASRVAVMSDIHGNIWALRVVLRDIERRGIEKIVNLGDSLYGPLDPQGTAQILIRLNIPTVRGNEDRIILDPPAEQSQSPTLRYVLNSLAPEHLAWLRSLDMTTVAYDHFFLCHGTPEQDDQYLLQEVIRSGVSLRKTGELRTQLCSVELPVVLCGHDHVPHTVYLPDGRLIVNPGSVGLAAYTDDLPFPHAMETGSPHARYSIAAKTDSGWQVENIALPYDWEAAARMALQAGRPDWAEWLKRGRA
ncbi:MAG: metallophosphoesterase family protein [Candidatus Aminicenantes bacterium]|nr:metallophosphoesterase family protein [Candidatus Aminicenantes bacterium]